MVGLYDPRFEHDSCGFGLIAQLDDRRSSDLVAAALSALARMSHRGGIGGDGLSGDGCGLLLRRPESFLRALAEESGIRVGMLFASGLVFLSRDHIAAESARRELAAQAARLNLHVAGWREVPIDESACGPAALATMPRIEQVFVNAEPGSDTGSFARALYRLRRRTEIALQHDNDFFVVSLSPWSIGYKGMVIPGRLGDLYPDLSHAEVSASAAVFHQRFSTNTEPRWALAQPFRFLAHNGEINSIQGNR
ncbi:MAG: glutamate synthase large subunit, partial [Xanthomonadales bacterium]|nr:glutamate synthase large subunit [Xanthomonadales bacterium]